MEAARAALRSRGYAWIERDFQTPEHAFALARAVVAECCADEDSASLSVIGDFVIPPADRGPSRDFQTLHFDFGVPLEPSAEQDVALYTALHVPNCVEHVSASTRLVALSRLLSQRTWASRPQLVERLIRYGRTHGAWDDACGYAEGSLARIVEAVDGSLWAWTNIRRGAWMAAGFGVVWLIVDDLRMHLSGGALSLQISSFGNHSCFDADSPRRVAARK